MGGYVGQVIVSGASTARVQQADLARVGQCCRRATSTAARSGHAVASRSVRERWHESGYVPRPATMPRHGQAHAPAVYWRRRTVVAGLLAASGYAAVRGIGALIRPGHEPGDASVTTSTVPGTIRTENERPGSSDFMFPFADDVMSKVHAYASTDSARAGDVVSIMSSTKGTTVSARAFRMGWYGAGGWSGGVGGGGCVCRPAPDRTVGRDSTTGDDPVPMVADLRRRDRRVVGARDVPLPASSPTTAARHSCHSWCSTIDRPTCSSISAITTWQAYNEWGGARLYRGRRSAARASEGRQLRPALRATAGRATSSAANARSCSWSSRWALDVTYTTNLDLHARPEQTTTATRSGSRWPTTSTARSRCAGARSGPRRRNQPDVPRRQRMFRRIRLETAPDGPAQPPMVNYRVAERPAGTARTTTPRHGRVA